MEHHGLRQPAVASIGVLLDRIRSEQPQVWFFVTNNGALWSEQIVLARRTG